MKALATGLAVALVALGLLGGKLWRDLREERAANQALMAGIAAPAPAPVQGAAPAETPASTPPAQQPALVAVPAAAPPAAAAAVPAPAAATVDDPMRDMMKAARAYLDTPEGQELQRVMLRQQLQQQHRDIVEKLGLSAAEVEKLLDMLVRHQMTESPIQMEAMTGGGDAAAMDAMYRRLADMERAHGMELQQLLGDRFPRWLEHEREASTRQREDMRQQQSQQLRTVVTSSGRNPLTDAQFEALSTALTAEEQRFDREHGNLSMQKMLEVLDERTRRLSEVAAVHLNSDQLAQYRAYLQQQAEMMRATMGMMGGAAAAPGN